MSQTVHKCFDHPWQNIGNTSPYIIKKSGCPLVLFELLDSSTKFGKAKYLFRNKKNNVGNTFIIQSRTEVGEKCRMRCR